MERTQREMSDLCVELRGRYGERVPRDGFPELPEGFEWAAINKVDDLNGDALEATGEEVPMRYTYPVWIVQIKKRKDTRNGVPSAQAGEGPSNASH